MKEGAKALHIAQLKTGTGFNLYSVLIKKRLKSGRNKKNTKNPIRSVRIRIHFTPLPAN